MKKIIPILSGLAILIIAYGSRQFYLLYNAKFGVKKTQIKGISAKEINILIDAEFKNKSDISAKVHNQHYEVFFNNVLVLTINIDKLIHINSNGKTIIQIPIIFNPSLVVKAGMGNILDLLFDRSKIIVEIKGYLSIKVGIIELKNYKVSMKQTLQELIDIAKKPKEGEEN